LCSATDVVGTVQVMIVLIAHVELRSIKSMLTNIAQSTQSGAKLVASALPIMNQEIMPTLSITIPTTQMMLAFSRLMMLTGVPAAADPLHATLISICSVLRRFSNGEEILGNFGAHAMPVIAVTNRRMITTRIKKGNSCLKATRFMTWITSKSNF